jgi:hypothetical protein
MLNTTIIPTSLSLRPTLSVYDHGLQRYPQNEGFGFPIDRLTLVLLGRVSPLLHETRLGENIRGAHFL